MDHNTTTQRSADEDWSAQAEAELFDGLERYPPVGACKYFNVASLAALLRRNAHLHVSPAALWRRLGSLYNLPRLEEEESQEFRAVIKFKPPPPDEEGDNGEEEEEVASGEGKDEDGEVVSSSEEEVARGKGRARGHAKADEKEEEEEGEEGGSDDARPAKRARVDRAVPGRGGGQRQARNQRDDSDDEEKEGEEEDDEEEGEEEDEDEDEDDAMKGEKGRVGASHGGAVGGGRLAARKEKLEAAFEEMATNSRLKYASFTELIYAALKTLGGSAELQQIYDWVGRDENWRRLDKKYASRFENSSSNYKSNIRSTLYSNSLFVKLDGSTWSIAPTEAQANSKGKKGAGKK